MKRRKLIYQRTDRFEESVGIDSKVIESYDRKMKETADVTIYVSRELFNEETGECTNPLFLDHGVDFDLFVSAEKDKSVPAELKAVPRPVIGYFGTIHRHSVDIELVEKVADLLPEMSFVFIGAAESDLERLSNRKNILMLGQKPYQEIPQYGKCFDVAVLPWAKNRWTEAANPVKVKEYLALGKPFVTTPVFTQLNEYLDVAYVGRTPEEFAAAIKKALAENSPQLIAKRREKIRDSSWESKAQLVIAQLFNKEKLQEVACG